jgi:glutathione S-transferase
MLKVWGRRSSFNVQKVMWLIGELGLAHEHVDAGGRFGGLDTPEFLTMNPHGRVPVIREGDAIVWESHAILRYLAARHGGENFWSGDPATRARIEGWMDWSQTSLQPDFLVGVFWDFSAPRRTCGTGRRSGLRFHAAPGILKNWTGCCRAGRFCSATR